MVQYGYIPVGSLVSAPIELRNTDRVLMIAVTSLASNTFWASFQPVAGNGFYRYLNPITVSGAVFRGDTGGFGIVDVPPATTMRLEINAAATAVASFCVVEVSPR